MGLNFCSGRKDLINSHQYNNTQQFSANYTLSDTIGRGSYSKVKLAYQNTTHNRFAVKIIQKAEVLKNNLYPSILREKQILQRFQSQSNSPFIIELLECCQDFEHLYFVMEYASKGNLRQLLQHKKNLKMQNIKFICVCILLALQALHQKGIIHGDLKPENILISQDGYLKIADFSSAQYYNCLNKEVKGTKGYIAPEIRSLNKFKLVDSSSDFYSLGCILWEMAHGGRYQDFLRTKNSKCRDNQLTGDSSDESVDTPMTDPVFQDFAACLLKQNPQERLAIKNVWTHPWLNFTNDKKDVYLHKKVTPHPFHSLQEFFEYNRLPCHDYVPKSKRNMYEQGDSLLSSVLLNQKRYQNLFTSFSTSSSKKGTISKVSSENSSEFKLI